MQSRNCTLTSVLAAGASFGLGIFRANQAEGALEDVSRTFLQSIGFNEQAADILSDFSSNGHSSLLLLTQYAQYKGYDLAKPDDQESFAAWVNGLDSENLTKLKDALNHKIDDYDGDPSKLGSDTDIPQADFYRDGEPYRSVTPAIFEPTTVGEIDAFLTQNEGSSGREILPQAV